MCAMMPPEASGNRIDYFQLWNSFYLKPNSQLWSELVVFFCYAHHSPLGSPTPLASIHQFVFSVLNKL